MNEETKTKMHEEIDQAIKSAMERNVGQTMNTDLATGVYITLSQQTRQIIEKYEKEE